MGDATEASDSGRRLGLAGTKLGVRVPGEAHPSKRGSSRGCSANHSAVSGERVIGRGRRRARPFCRRLIGVGPCGWECLPMNWGGCAHVSVLPSVLRVDASCGEAGPCVSLCLSFEGC